MKIYQDRNEKHGQHDNLETYFAKHGIEVERVVLKVGDYMIADGLPISVDIKQDVLELAGDLFKDSKNFYKKYSKCLQYGIKLTVLVQQPVPSLRDLVKWKSKHTKINGAMIVKMIDTIKYAYGVRVMFCKKSDAPQILLDILGGNI